MDRERWRLIETLYHAARSMPPGARADFLATECRGNESLRSEVESLIAQPDATWAGPGRSGDGATDDILGKRVGQYDVQSLLGAGGMGRVYRARDTRLGRNVALKLLPPEWTGDPDRLARLEREARLLASLNHPNIATIHGIEDAAGLRALVLEYIEGETLADRIARSALPIAEALAIARQVQDALDAAHERGIVHRDLKPANIAITTAGLVKVLDFGIATLEAAPDASAPQGSQAPTVTARGTREGVAAGTAAYMSPEQARGLAIDKRTDIWAFGCVLYEMLARRPVFGRATLTDTFAAIVEREPDWGALPPDTPPGIVRLLKRCLEKERRKRLRDIGDADAVSSDVSVAVRRHRWWPLAMTAAIAIAVSATAIYALRPRSGLPQATGPITLTLRPPDEHQILAAPLPSPDGMRLAFVAIGRNGRSALWLRSLGETTAKQLAGTEDAENPFWSADGRFIGFAAGERLRKIDVERSSVQTICTCLTGDLLGAAWNRDDVIVFAPHNRVALHRVAAAGGSAVSITTLDVSRNENSHRRPEFLPDGRHLLFTARSDVTGNTGIYFLDLVSGERHWLLAAQSQAKYVPSGHLLFVRERTLLAQPFDATSGRLSGEPRPIANDVDQTSSSASAAFAISANGEVLTYQGGSQQTRRLLAFDRSGVQRAAFGTEDRWQDLRLSPDGKRAAVVKSDENGNRDIWLMDLASGLPRRWSSHPATDWRPVWDPESRSLLFASDRNGASAIFRRNADGRDADQLIAPAAGPTAGRFPNDWGRNDRIVFTQDAPDGGTQSELWIGTASPGGQLKGLPTVGAMTGGRLSPDARWLAYSSNETGAWNVYVTSIDGSTTRRISTDGGTHPQWRQDGGEILYYAFSANALMSVPVKLEPTIDPSAPVRLFPTCLRAPLPAPYENAFDLKPDGTTFWLCPGDHSQQGIVTVVVGWKTALTGQAK
jgi:eukaryotic-like serine/threonine-protein kinase